MRLLILAAVPVFLAVPVTGQTRTPGSWERVGTLPIDESSGVAVSRRFPGVFWTHNDSGDDPRVFAVRRDGSLIATYDILGARAVDWEDMALGPCPWDRTATCLVLGDIGDNAETRTRVVLYFVEEPDPTGPGDSARALGPAHSVRLRYADRPHDAEGLAIDPQGNVTIVTKGRTGPILRYTIPARDLAGDSVVAAPRDTMDIVPQRMLGRWVSGAAIRPDGRGAVVRTYTEIFLYTIDPAGRWKAEGVPCFLGLREAQGEAIDFLDDRTLIVTSERSTGEPAVHTLRC